MRLSCFLYKITFDIALQCYRAKMYSDSVYCLTAVVEGHGEPRAP
jgi:hypothetical protein